MFTVFGTLWQMIWKIAPDAPVFENGKYKTPAKDNTHPTEWKFTPKDTNHPVLESKKVESSKCPLAIVESGTLYYRKHCPWNVGKTPWSEPLMITV